MKIALFARYGTQLRNLSEAGLKALGHEIVFQAPQSFDEAQAIREVDGAVVCGTLRGPLGEAAAYYQSLGKTVVLLDAPHLRGIKQWRVTPPNHAYVPFAGQEAPRDRLDALGIKLNLLKPKDGGYCVLAGQKDGDSAHWMTRKQILVWARKAIEKVRSLSNAEICWRPHPQDIWPLREADRYSNPSEESLADCLKGAAFMVTYNSTAGLEALMAGIPVIAEGKATYAELCGSFQDFKNLAPPKPKALENLLAKIAYTQWSDFEIASGYPFQEFFPGRKEILLFEGPSAQEAPEEPKPEKEPAPVKTGSPRTAKQEEPAPELALTPDADEPSPEAEAEPVVTPKVAPEPTPAEKPKRGPKPRRGRKRST